MSESATEVAKWLKAQGLTMTIIPPAMSGLSARWRVEGPIEGMRSLLAECQRLREDNCNLATLNESLMEDGNALRAEAARWQAVAVEERAKSIYYDPDEETGQRPTFAWEDLADDAADVIREQAAASLGQPRAWLMTGERKDALNSVIRDSFEITEEEIETLRAMLAEAGQ